MNLSKLVARRAHTLVRFARTGSISMGVRASKFEACQFWLTKVSTVEIWKGEYAVASQGFTEPSHGVEIDVRKWQVAILQVIVLLKKICKC